MTATREADGADAPDARDGDDDPLARAPTERWRELSEAGMAIAYWAAIAPDRPALIPADASERDQHRTYAQLNARVNQLVRGLRAVGLRRGDGVAVLLPNTASFVETYWACLRGGWRFTPINFHLGVDEVGYILADCGARAFVADVRFAAIARAAAARTTSLIAPVASDGEIDGFASFDLLLADRDPVDIDDPVAGSTMLYTSGTTGRPKGVFRERLAALVADRNIYQPGEVHLLTGPLYHAAPLSLALHPPLSCGGSLVVMSSWDGARALELIEAHRVTNVHLVPTMFHRLLALPEATRRAHDVSSLAVVVHGAAPCPVAVKQAMIDWWGPIIWEYYAATEGAGTLVDPFTWQAHPGTVGKPADGQVIVGDQDARPLPPGEIGLLWLRSPADERFCYLGDDEKTAGSFRGDHFTLGDLGYLDDEGYLYLSDRSAHLIISGGVNIYPAEVDAVLLEHPAVGDAAVIGVPNDEWGEEVKAVVELQPDAGSGRTPAELEAELIAFCRDRLAHFKCPRSVAFVDELPRQDNGKIAKVRLRDQYR